MSSKFLDLMAYLEDDLLFEFKTGMRFMETLDVVDIQDGPYADFDGIIIRNVIKFKTPDVYVTIEDTRITIERTDEDNFGFISKSKFVLLPDGIEEQKKFVEFVEKFRKKYVDKKFYEIIGGEQCKES